MLHPKGRSPLRLLPGQGCATASQPRPCPQPDDRVPACAAGKPRGLGPRKVTFPLRVGGGHGRRWQGMAGRFLLALVGLTLSGLRFPVEIIIKTVFTDTVPLRNTPKRRGEGEQYRRRVGEGGGR